MCKTWTYDLFSENPLGRPAQAEKEDVSWLTRTYGNPTLKYWSHTGDMISK